MVSLVKSVFFAAVLSTLLCLIQCDESDEEASEEDPIRQALLLIQLIRRAGAALQQNSLFVKHGLFPGPRSPDAPLSPHEVSNFSDTNNITSEQMYRRKMSEVNSERINPISPEEKHHPTFYRRSQDIEDLTSPPSNVTYLLRAELSSGSTIGNDQQTSKHPNDEKSKSTNVDATKTTPPRSLPAATTPKATPSKINVARANIKNPTTKKPPGRTNKITQNRKNGPIRENQNQNMKKTATEGEEKSLIMSQVATELQNEMEQMSGQDRSDAVNAYRKFSKEELIARLRPTKTPTTIRVHLASSTRYPIPFPMNHALCYTDPNNGLCRTPL